MIKSKFIRNNRVIATDFFQSTMDMSLATDYEASRGRADYGDIYYDFTENRFTNFSILSQDFRCQKTGKLEIDYEGEPLMLISVAKRGEVLRTRNSERLWLCGDVNLTISPQCDIALNSFKSNTCVELLNVALPKHFVERLCKT